MSAAPPPIAMLAELTHRCPLKCPYCSNPLELTRRSGELATETWIDAFHQAARLGVMQVHLSGGEPAARRDLPELITGAREADLYTNLITSGVGLSHATFRDLESRGLDHVQLSLQGAEAETADRIGGYRGGFAAKMRVAGWVAEAGIPLTLNAVMHRQNLDRLAETIALAVSLGARRLEIAHTQYHGWAERNRGALMPTSAQVRRAGEVVAEASTRLRGQLAIDYVTPDHLAHYPKACMGGWGRLGLVITPAGKVLPCHAAETITSLSFETLLERPLAEIWHDGAAFTAYRGTGWMPEPCRSCPRQAVDWGGCRCQAFALTGDAGAADPACVKAPGHAAVEAMRATTSGDDFIYRTL